MKKTAMFRELLKKDELIVIPGAPTALLARVVEKAGFQVVYVTGAGLANMNFAMSDFNLITMSENLEIAKRINDAVSVPVFADIDDGYGGPINVYRTVREYSKAGIAALQLEDQRSPKRCGHFEDHEVVSIREMVAKIHAAKDASTDPDLVLVARTDAISATNSFDDALERGAAYAEAGADVIFIEAPTTLDQIQKIPGAIKAPTLLNLVEKGKTPMISNEQIGRMGYKIALYANAVLKASVLGVQNLLSYLKETGTTDGCDGTLMISSKERHELLDKEFYEELIKRYG